MRPAQQQLAGGCSLALHAAGTLLVLQALRGAQLRLLHVCVLAVVAGALLA
jgi:hypothetical protein